jgi:hypothetical protein
MRMISIFKLFSAITLSLLFLGGLTLGVLFRLVDPTGHTTDVAQYPAILARFEHAPLIQHFPSTLPADATHVQLDYLPRLMQGGMHFQLRLQVPSDQIDRLGAQFHRRAQYVLSDDASTPQSTTADRVPPPKFYTSTTDTDTFPPMYELLVFDAHAAGSPDAVWNHGQSAGVAINRAASEIVYWAEAW